MEQDQDLYKYAGLILKHLREQASVAEQQELEAWLDKDVRRRQLLESLQHRETLRDAMAFHDTIDVDADWQAVMARATPVVPGKKVAWRRMVAWTAAAAVLTAAIIAYKWYTPLPKPAKMMAVTSLPVKNDILPGSSNATLRLGNGQTVHLGSQPEGAIKEADGTTIAQQPGGLVYNKTNESPATTLFNTLSTAKAGQYQLTLEDGTRVWLNAASSLRFPVHFSNGERRVELTGEGYFEVAASPDKPFRVMVQNMEVLVLGTHFNVGAYSKAVKTTLITGAVKIRVKDERDWQLLPGQQADVQDSQVRITTADTEKAIAWKEGIFFFRDDDFREIMNQVARWYDLDIRYTGPLPAKRISGNISRQAKLSQVLEMLNFVSGAHFRVNGREVTVSMTE
ncbi:FecR family protein [Chitinophaga sp.]|uniref:FecR family protein n=1 Tax=Chitinophaga sp. TaxID=1869181 RepID=UPI002C819A75|nr:FecR domain-containing protein [Chitinophaga sp.]HWV67532.1 FecR domain-containing protein [Chitinophaga sp.]